MGSGRGASWGWMILLAGLALGCDRQPRQVRVGIALDSQNHVAVELAVEQINQAGGIRGVPMEAVGMDWQHLDIYDPIDIVDRAHQFASLEDLVAVIGHSDSASTLAAAALYNRHQIPHLVTIATNPAITNIGDWTYRLCISDSEQGPALAEYAVREWGKKRMALFYVNDEYGRGLAGEFEKRAIELGGEIVARTLHRNWLEEADYELIRETIRVLKEAQPDLVVLFQRPGAADWTIQELHRSRLQVDLLGGDSLGADGFLQTHPELKEGFRAVQFFRPDLSHPSVQIFAQEIQRRIGRSPDYGQAFAHDAVQLIREALLQGGIDRQSLRQYLDELIVEQRVIFGVGGPYRLGPDHDARRDFYIVEARNGEYRLVKTVQIES